MERSSKTGDRRSLICYGSAKPVTLSQNCHGHVFFGDSSEIIFFQNVDTYNLQNRTMFTSTQIPFPNRTMPFPRIRHVIDFREGIISERAQITSKQSQFNRVQKNIRPKQQTDHVHTEPDHFQNGDKSTPHTIRSFDWFWLYARITKRKVNRKGRWKGQCNQKMSQ